MKSYRAEELFDANGSLMPEIAALAPKGARRMGANPKANGGVLLRDLTVPDFLTHAFKVPPPGAADARDTLVLGGFLRDVTAENLQGRNFRIFGPDETLSNMLGDVFEVTHRQWDVQRIDGDKFRALWPTGRHAAQRASMRGMA
jgi:xylulose-5-phosphate/fructose-6-phosphate phosphoketolase